MNSVNLKWRRQFSSSRRVRVGVLAAVSAVCVVFALFLWWFAEAWVILPFAGLEIVCVAAAFGWLERSVGDFDWVRVTQGRVTVVRCRAKHAQRFEFINAWLVAELKRDRMGGAQGIRLLQSGRCVELLEFLPVSEQHRALRELRTALATRNY
jgi:uncharacterized membrane protein